MAGQPRRQGRAQGRADAIDIRSRRDPRHHMADLGGRLQARHARRRHEQRVVGGERQESGAGLRLENADHAKQIVVDRQLLAEAQRIAGRPQGLGAHHHVGVVIVEAREETSFAQPQPGGSREPGAGADDTGVAGASVKGHRRRVQAQRRQVLQTGHVAEQRFGVERRRHRHRRLRGERELHHQGVGAHVLEDAHRFVGRVAADVQHRDHR